MNFCEVLVTRRSENDCRYGLSNQHPDGKGTAMPDASATPYTDAGASESPPWT